MTTKKNSAAEEEETAPDNHSVVTPPPISKIIKNLSDNRKYPQLHKPSESILDNSAAIKT